MAVTVLVRALGAASGSDPSPCRGSAPAWRAAGGRPTGLRPRLWGWHGVVRVGAGARAGGRAGRVGGAAGLKVRRAADRARGGLRGAPRLGAAEVWSSPGASSGVSREQPTRQAGCVAGGRGGVVSEGILCRGGSFSCVREGGALGEGGEGCPGAVQLAEGLQAILC